MKNFIRNYSKPLIESDESGIERREESFLAE